MSHEAIAWAYKQTLRTGAKFVLVALADFADEEGSCYPSQERLATMTGMSDRAVRVHLSTLESDGYITRGRRWRSDGARTSDRYILCLDRDPATSQPEESAGYVAPEESANLEESAGEACGYRKNLPAPTGSFRQSLPEDSSREPPEGTTKNSKTDARERASRIPDDFTITDDMRSWLQDQRLPESWAERITEEFVDYWRSKPGQAAKKLDWPATWRNWLRRVSTERPPQHARVGSGGGVPWPKG